MKPKHVESVIGHLCIIHLPTWLQHVQRQRYKQLSMRLRDSIFVSFSPPKPLSTNKKTQTPGLRLALFFLKISFPFGIFQQKNIGDVWRWPIRIPSWHVLSKGAGVNLGANFDELQPSPSWYPPVNSCSNGKCTFWRCNFLLKMGIFHCYVSLLEGDVLFITP